MNLYYANFKFFKVYFERGQPGQIMFSMSDIFLGKVYINVDLFISFIDSFSYTFSPDFPLFLQTKKELFMATLDSLKLDEKKIL